MMKRFFTFAFTCFVLFTACGGASDTTTDDTTSDTGSTDTGSTSTEELCDNSSMPSYNYMMVFHACDTAEEDCSIPNNHYAYLAGSDDGITWNLIDEFESINVSVPSIAYYDNKLILIAPGANDDSGVFDWRTYNACMQTLDQGLLERDVEFASGTGFTDPSPIVIDDTLHIIHKASATDGTAICASGCTMDFASATAESFPSFTAEGSLATLTLPVGGFTDPQIVQKDDGTFLLYASSGASLYAYSSDSLTADSFVSEDYDHDGTAGDLDDRIGAGVGGVAGGIQGDDDKVWLYVNSALPTDPDVYVIRLAKLDTGLETVVDGDFTSVLTGSIVTDMTKASVESPYIIHWPDANWTRTVPASE